MLDKFQKIRAFVFDVDGVLTDGTLLLLHHGHMARRMNIKDGYALQLAVKSGYRIVVVSGSHSEASKDRLERLGITDVRMDVKDKAAELKDIMKRYGMSREETLYMGDDMPDLPAMAVAGLSCCPSDAVPEVKEACHYISPLSGGMCCVRDVIEKVMKLHGKWNADSGLASI
jgi:3-deoxy-D-manno-octulosonate 8-phosphate phosphatase (KDO 8-P phosphatase)